MNFEESLPNSYQENLIVLLCFNTEVTKKLRNNLNISLFDNIFYREIAKRAINYYDQFGVSPYEHTPEICEDLLDSKQNQERSEIYKNIILNINANKETINIDFVLNRLEEFIFHQTVKLSVIEAARKCQDGDIGEAVEILGKCKKTELSVFNPGVFFPDQSRISRIKSLTENLIHTGIEQLDIKGICPAPKELFVFGGLSGKGKSWFLVNLAKHAWVTQRKKVLHVSLEMSEDRMEQRYAQAFFGISNKKEVTNIPIINREGTDFSIAFKEFTPKHSFEDNNIEAVLYKKYGKFSQGGIVYKEFPGGFLTIQKLLSYLDNMENFYNFIPDLLLIDYADKFQMPGGQRHDLDVSDIYIQLRGIGVDRNFSVVTVSQLRNDSENMVWPDGTKLLNASGKKHEADNVIIYCQTPLEKEMGFARLFVDKGRNNTDGQKILITQNYSIGQFCIDSFSMSNTKKYFDQLKEV